MSTYAFLSKPPPQKRRPTQPLPSPPPTNTPRRITSTTFSSTIAFWAAHVQPGSPPPRSPHSPRSPRRHCTSISSKRRPSLTIVHVPSSPIIISTPTTAQSKTFDLTTLGYTSVFIHLPKTPSTPSPLLKAKAQKDHDEREAKRKNKEEKREKRLLMMKRFKTSLTLRTRSKSVSGAVKEADVNKPLGSPLAVLPSPTFTTVTAPLPRSKVKSKPKPKQPTSAKKRAFYSSIVRPPPPLSNELALMQFADGGKMDDHIRRVMKEVNGRDATVAFGDVWRDGKGGMWWDREEEMEYRGLLGGEGSEEDEDLAMEDEGEEWVKFDLVPPTITPIPRRESISTLDSDLDPAYIVKADEETRYFDERVLNLQTLSSVMSFPSRSKKVEKHLRKGGDIVPCEGFWDEHRLASESPMKERRVRRRPEPLMIKTGTRAAVQPLPIYSQPLPPIPLPPRPTHTKTSMTVDNDNDAFDIVRRGKKEFMLDCFEPEVSKFDFSDDERGMGKEEGKEILKSKGVKKQRSRLDLRGIFR